MFSIFNFSLLSLLLLPLSSSSFDPSLSLPSSPPFRPPSPPSLPPLLQTKLTSKYFVLAVGGRPKYPHNVPTVYSCMHTHLIRQPIVDSIHCVLLTVYTCTQCIVDSIQNSTGYVLCVCRSLVLVSMVSPVTICSSFRAHLAKRE